MSTSQTPTGLTRGYSNFCIDSRQSREDPPILTIADLDRLDEEQK
jgi:hypothetical protein